MEIEGEDGTKLFLKAGVKTVLGRGSGFNTNDLTVSRRHVPLELSEFDRVSFEVLGKNPVWCIGLDNSGKTTIVMKINGEDTSVISPTLGFNIKTIIYQKYTLNIWDVSGQKTIRSYWRNYFEQTDGLVWVVDSSDLRRLDDCKMELDNLLKEERLAGSSLVILANKQDIQGVEEMAQRH